MMDFARRLAPASAADASRAVAVLPSRFGGESPSAVGVATPQVERPAAPSLDGVPRELQPADGGDAAHVVRAPSREPSGAVRSAGLALREMRLPMVSAAPTERIDEERAAAPRGPSSMVPMRSAVARPIAQPAVTRPSTSPAAAEGTARGEASSGAIGSSPMSRPTAPQPPAPRRPLSDAALAARSAQAVPPPRPIVHVTIDRIEVRAPAPSARPTPAAPQRSATPSVSLGDYLRQRTARRGGPA